MVLACATALLASVAALLEISDRTLRVQPDIKFELTLRGGTGCIELPFGKCARKFVHLL